MTGKDSLPAIDPFTASESGAVATHEFFENLVKAGFSEDRAARLVAHILRLGPVDGS